MSDRYMRLKNRLEDGDFVILDGGVGTELEKRGVEMDASWCGSASMNTDVLKKIHLDYINSGAEVITANTYASSRLMLDAAGLGEHFEEINLKAIQAARQARKEAGNDNILIAGSLSHRFPIADGDVKSDPAIKVSSSKLLKTCLELSSLLAGNGCDLIILEMMYHPDRIKAVFDAANSVKKPVWAGFSLRRSESGKIVSLTDETTVPFEELLSVTEGYDFEVMGIMHTSVDLITDSVKILREVHKGPIMVYPDSGGWISPNWDFSRVIKPQDFKLKAKEWKNEGVQIIGGCCGLSPDHIKLLQDI